MNNILYDVPEYYTATEAFSVSNIKPQVTKLIKLVYDTIQKFGLWVTSKFCTFLNIDMVIVNQDYYNDIMHTIDMVCNIDLPMMSKVDAAINLLRNNPENVKLIYGDLQKKLDDIKLIAENVEKTVPSNHGSTIKISTAKLKHLKLTFLKMQADAKSQMTKLKSIKSDPNNIETLKYTQAQLVIIGYMATINGIKSSICMRLLNRLMENAIKNKDSMNEDSATDNVVIEGLESFVSFCNNMTISNEGLNKYKKIYHGTKKDISMLDKEYHNISENTIDEIDCKIDILKNILSQINDAQKLMSKITPDIFDKFINTLAIVADGTLMTVATMKVRNDVAKFNLGSPEIYHVLKNILFLLPMSALFKTITTKATIAGKKANCKELNEKLNIAHASYTDEMYRLIQKRKTMVNS